MASRARSESGSRAYRQFLLLAVLLFGIVTMHTVGHPAEHAAAPGTRDSAPYGSGEAEAGPATVPVARAASIGASPASVAPMPVTEVAFAGAGPMAPDAGHPSHGSPDDAPMSGMDPLSVCLAVLGAWGLALFGAWLLGLCADGRLLGTPVGAGLLRVLRPNPPPPISVLASVSVLRI